MIKVLRFAAVLTVLAASGAAGAETLHLVCLGQGSGNRAFQSFGTASDNRGNSAWGQSVGVRAVPFDDQVNIEIADDATGRVRMPRMMLPGLRGGSDGWFDIKKVQISENEITGVVQVNILNSPKLRLDRIQGRVSIQGKSGDYSGECQPYDPATVQRRF